MALAQDAFDRPDDPDLGPVWSPQFAGSSLQILSFTVRASVLGTPAEEQLTTFSPTTGNMYAQILIRGFTSPSANALAGAYIRAVDPGIRTYYLGIALKSGGSQIVKRIAGNATVIASESATVWGTNDVLTIEGLGSTITLKRNGITVLSVTDFDLTVGKGGMYIFEDGDLTQTRIDNFEVGDLVPIPQNIITWQDNATDEDGFLIQRKSEACVLNNLAFADLVTVGPDVVTYVDTAVVAGGTYAYRVRAFNSFGNSAFTACADRQVPGGDSTFPIVTIDFPTTDPTYITPVPTEVGGTATDDIGIASMTWSSDRGASGLVNFVSGSWITIGLASALQLGVNNITVSATDSSGNTSTDTIQITFGTTTGTVGQNQRMIGITY